VVCSRMGRVVRKGETLGWGRVGVKKARPRGERGRAGVGDVVIWGTITLRPRSGRRAFW
jgi:hypothetical protein